MKRLIALGLMAGALLGSAQAEKAPQPWLRPFVGLGYSFGGNTIQHTTLTPQTTSIHYEDDISAGAGLELSAGLALRIPNSPFSLRGSVGHHVDGSHGISLQSSFWRTPFEAGVQWHVNERGTLGFGWRHAVRAKYQSKGGTCTDQATNTQYACPDADVWLSGSHGWYLEGEWAMYPSWGLRVQAVHEQFTVKPPLDPVRFNGDHIGIMTIFYFN